MLLTIHSVNMYASTWICTKEIGLEKEDIKTRLRQTSLAELRLEAPAMHVEE
jgi:betaine lipid synthase